MACEDARGNQQNNGKTRRKGIFYEWGGLMFWLGLFVFCVLLRSFVNGDLRFGPETIGDMIARKDIYAGVVGVECSSYTLYSYDDQDRQTEMLVYTRDNKDSGEWTVHTREVWEYDSQGRLTEQFSYGRIKVPEWEMKLSDGSYVHRRYLPWTGNAGGNPAGD